MEKNLRPASMKAMPSECGPEAVNPLQRIT